MSSEYEWKEPRPSRGMHPIPKSAYGHFVVQMVIHDCDEDPGQVSRCGSLSEYLTRMIALAQPDTTDVIEQVGPLHWWDQKNEQHDHFLDHIVMRSDGRRLGLTDKPYKKVSEDFGKEIAQVRKDGRKKDLIDELFLVTEYARDPVKLHNADLFRGCRDAEEEVDLVALNVVENLEEETTLQALVDEISRGPRGFRALVRLIRSGELMQKCEEKITHETVVLRGDVSNV